MPDPRFFKVQGPFSAKELAKIGDAKLTIANNINKKFFDVKNLVEACPDDVSFLHNAAYRKQFMKSKAGLCVLHSSRQKDAPKGMALLLSETPYLAYAKIVQAFYPGEQPKGYVAESSVIDKTAVLGDLTSVGAGAVIKENVKIGSRCVIGENAIIGAGVKIGNDCRIGVSTSIHFSLIGSRVVLYAGARLGEAGFGFASSSGEFVTLPQLGRVIVGDDVEIGANTTVDRGSGSDTVIGKGCRIDNLVQIAHNVKLGEGCILVSQAGIAGSTKVGKQVVIGGQAAIAGHLSIGDKVKIGGQSGILKDIPAGAQYAGSPGVPMRQWLRQAIILRRMARKRHRDVQ